MSAALRPKKYFSKYKESLAPLPDFVDSQLASFDWLIKAGLSEVLKEFSPIKDYSEKKFELEIVGFDISAPKYDEYYAKDNKLSYEAPMKMRVRLNKDRKSTRLNSSHSQQSRMPSSA